MVIHKRSAASVVGGRTARACDACVRRRARWYCTADDAFLCQVCDTSVHSANQLASRHERVRLESSSGLRKRSSSVITEPSWLHGFTKKARSRRHAHISKSMSNYQEGKKDESCPNIFLPLVPEIGSDETIFFDENDDQILYQVPVFNPFACDEPTFDDHESKMNYDQHHHREIDDFEGFLLPSDQNELIEFTSHIESLLVEELAQDGSCDERCGSVKVEDHVDGEEIDAVLALQFDPMVDAMREISDWNFKYDESTMIAHEDDVEKVLPSTLEEPMIQINNKMALKLNYDDVITSWANQGSPWLNGTRPDLNLDDCWPNFTAATSPAKHNRQNGGDVGGHMVLGDGEREARVTRYKEKRRTRLFSKKIRYEVRKLNAEKRPRMRGRFVKRSLLAVPTFPAKLINLTT